MKRLLCFVIVGVLLLSCAACGAQQETPTTTTTTTPTTTTTTKPAPVMDYNLLTGEYDLEKGAPNRPIGFMVPNDSKTIGHQPHIDKADFYMECETEGAIPRMMAMFASIDRVPDTYGPIRSARVPFVATARALGAIYVHCGGSAPADAILKTGVLNRINAISESSSLFWRDPTLRSRIDYVHSLVTGRDKLKARIEQKKFSLNKVKDVPFTFGEKTGTQAAMKVQMNTTPSHRATFIYDEETGLYGKNIGKMDSCKPHLSMEGNQLKVANVVILFAEKYVDGNSKGGTLYNFKEGTGKGFLFAGGTYREIAYTRTADSLSFQELDGTGATFAKGKIYMVLADKSLESKIVVE